MGRHADRQSNSKNPRLARATWLAVVWRVWCAPTAGLSPRTPLPRGGPRRRRPVVAFAPPPVGVTTARPPTGLLAPRPPLAVSVVAPRKDRLVEPLRVSSLVESDGRFFEPPRADAKPFVDAPYEEGESYEKLWRKRTAESLRSAPELTAVQMEELFEADYLQKRLWQQTPDAAYGAVFRLEGVLAEVDALPTLAAAWRAVAEEFGVAPPSDDLVRLAIQRHARDEVVIDTVFHWTNDWGRARVMARRYAELVAERFDDVQVAPRAGVSAWLAALKAQGVPCATVSDLPGPMLASCLERLNYTDYFDDRVVSAEDERDRTDQAFLHAALTLERQPSRCVVFSDAVPDLIGAHEAAMRCVGVLSSRHPAYELRVADLVVPDLAQLRLSNIRRLFSDRDFDEAPDLPGLERDLEPEPEVRRLKTIVMDRPEGDEREEPDLSEYLDYDGTDDDATYGDEGDYYDEGDDEDYGGGLYGDQYDDARDLGGSDGATAAPVGGARWW